MRTESKELTQFLWHMDWVLLVRSGLKVNKLRLQGRVLATQ